MSETTGSSSMQDYPRFRSHLLPRSRTGWIATLLFIGLLALAEPPFSHVIVNRIEPRIFGLPFLYAWLTLVYFALLGLLLWTHRRGL